MRKEVPSELLDDFKNKYMKFTQNELKEIYPEWNVGLLIKRIYEKYGRECIEGEKKAFKDERDKQSLLNNMWDIYNGGKYPEIRDFSTRYKLIKRLFGSFKNMLDESKIPIPEDRMKYFNRGQIEEDELFEVVRRFTWTTIVTKFRFPLRKDVDRCKELPWMTAINKKYGSFEKLVNLAFDKDLSGIDKFIEKEIIKYKVKKLSEVIGRTPTSRDLDEYSQMYKFMPSAKSVSDHFGGMVEFQVECGFIEGVRVGAIKTRENLADDLSKLYVKLQRPLTTRDVSTNSSLACMKTYTDEFGSWQEALRISNVKGADSKTKYYTDKNNRKVLSWYELKFANFLEENNIDYVNETPYSAIIETTKGYRFDFLIIYKELVYPVEIFGITNNQKYKETVENKINLCRENNLLLLMFFPSDIQNNKNLFDTIEQKIFIAKSQIINPHFINREVVFADLANLSKK